MKRFNYSMGVALLLGVGIGFLDLSLVQKGAAIIATVFVKMLKLISLPMIFLAIVSTVTQITSLIETGRIIKKILKYTLLTTLIAATIGFLLFVILQPVQTEEVTLNSIQIQGNYLTFFLKIIPDHLMQPFMDNNVLGMSFLAAVFSCAVLKLPTSQSALLRDFFKALFDALLKITTALMRLMPIGVFAFTIEFMHHLREGKEHVNRLLLYASCVVGANLIQGFIVLPLFLKLKGHFPWRAASKMFPALTMAFFSKSSSATLPLTLSCAKERLGVSSKTADFALPLCSIINMNGCAAFILITLFFVSSSEGMVWTIGEMIPWIALSTLAAIGNAGVPMGCFYLATAFLMGMGISIKQMGMILPLYSFFDMLETALNVWSDSCVTLVVDRELINRNS